MNLCDDYFSHIFQGTTEILNNEDSFPSEHLTSYYQSVFNLCHDENVSRDIIRDRLNTFIQDYLHELILKFDDLYGIELLEHYQGTWHKFQKDMDAIRRIFSYFKVKVKREFDTYHLGPTSIGYYNIVDILKHRWEWAILIALQDRFISVICDLVFQKNKESVQDTTDSLIVHVLECYRAMQPLDPKPVYIPATGEVPAHFEYDDRESKEIADEIYLLRESCKNSLLEEFYFYYDKNTFPAVISCDTFFDQLSKGQIPCEQTVRYLEILGFTEEASKCKCHVTPMFMEWHDEKLVNLYKNREAALLRQYYQSCSSFEPAFEYLACHFKRWIEADCRENVPNVDVSSVNGIKSIIDAVNGLRMKYLQLLGTICKENINIFAANQPDSKLTSSRPFFDKYLDSVLSKLINHYGNTESEKKPGHLIDLLVRHSDLLLSKASKPSAKTNIETEIDNILIIVNYLNDKDLFLHAYHKLFARRLVQRALRNEDAETYAIEALKKVFGNDQIRKLQILFTDNQISKELTAEFKSHDTYNNFGLDGIDLSVTVINQSVWPFNYNPSTVAIPRLNSTLEIFNTFYQHKHANRELNYLDNSYGETVCNGFEQKYCFVANVHQTSMLVMFNDADCYTFEQLSSGLQISKDHLIAVLSPMLKLGLFTADCDTITAETPIKTQIYFNLNFKSDACKINLMKGIRKPVNEVKLDLKEVESDRTMAVQAAIVRIMKKEKQLAHNPLVAEVIKALSNRFQPDIKFIKNCIAALLEKEYIARSPDDLEVYVYQNYMPPNSPTSGMEVPDIVWPLPRRPRINPFKRFYQKVFGRQNRE
uniref:CULLIN_2 domain-containing protein n=1 Tax=Panagrellus redivivus TaxID=6233 RepID=A0A7E4ZSK9_PANRE